jgi:polar amino acid transport system substrate-binding protein
MTNRSRHLAIAALKRRLRPYLWQSLLLTLLLCSQQGMALAADARSIRFATDKEKEGGFLLEITRTALERMGYRVEIIYKPWARALADVEAGDEEALLGAQFTEARATTMRYSAEIGQSEMRIFKLRETQIAYQKLADLQGYTVGTIQGAAYPPEFESATYFRKEAALDFSTNIRKLLAHRMPFFIEKKSVVLEALRTQFPADASKINYLSPPLQIFHFFNCFSIARQGYEHKVADFNAGLALIMKDGTYQAILNRGLHE